MYLGIVLHSIKCTIRFYYITNFTKCFHQITEMLLSWNGRKYCRKKLDVSHPFSLKKGHAYHDRSKAQKLITFI